MDQTSAVRSPANIVQLRVLSGVPRADAQWCFAAQRSVNALSVVVALEVSELSLKVARVPEQNVVEKLSPSRADQPFNEGMRDRDVGNRFDFVDFQYPQIGLPAMKLEQRIVVGAEISRWALSIKGVIEHAAHGGPIDVTAMNAEPDYATRELIHDDQYPVRIEQD